jgi:uncharacterized glyoxalase superfamily protein PhnB
MSAGGGIVAHQATNQPGGDLVHVVPAPGAGRELVKDQAVDGEMQQPDLLGAARQVGLDMEGHVGVETVLGVVVDDVDEIARFIIDEGAELKGEIVDEAWGQRYFFVRDPEGTWIGVIQLTSPAPEWLVSNLPS